MTTAAKSDGAVLTIDVGNLLTSLAVWQSDTAVRHAQISTNPRRTVDELAILFDHLLGSAGIDPADLAGAALACVVPALGRATAEACARVLGRPPLVVGPGVRSGVVIRTDHPHEVGADRIANAVAATATYGAPVIIVDFATALSIDVVDAAGHYVGTIIAPGLEVAADVLARRTALLGRIDLTAPPRAIGDSTIACLQSGIVLGHAAMVDGLVRRVRAAFGPASVVATGESAAAPQVVRSCTTIDHFAPLLTLDGLQRLFRAWVEHPSPKRRSSG